MPTDLETALANIDAAILAISVSPKPSYTIDGQNVDHDRHLATLLDTRLKIAEAIMFYDGYEGPVLIRSRGRSC
jgi:hypothetical protein